MYFLTNIRENTTFYLVNKDEFVLGRRSGDFLIPNDQSISRRHAVFRIENNQVTIEDNKSTYKTFCNGNALEPMKKVPIEVETEIKFGIFESVFKLKKAEFTTSGTNLKTADKIKLKDALQVISARYVDNWGPECTHLTVTEIYITVKFLHSLLDQKPVVTLDFWLTFADNVKNNKPPPDINKYNNPPIEEALLKNINLVKEISRKSLFENKIFIFSTHKETKQMESIIKKAGGQCKSWQLNPIPLTDLQSPKNYIVIRNQNQEEDQSFRILIQETERLGKRPIPFHEIALAVIIGSCETNCNPDFDRAGAVFKGSLPLMPTQTKPLVQNTESASMNIMDASIKFVPDTYDPPLDSVQSCTTQDKAAEVNTWAAAEKLLSEAFKRKRPERQDDDKASEENEPAWKKLIWQPSNNADLLQSSPYKRKQTDKSGPIKEKKSKKNNPFAFYQKVKTDPDENYTKRQTTFEGIKLEEKNDDAEDTKTNIFDKATNRRNIFKNISSNVTNRDSSKRSTLSNQENDISFLTSSSKLTTEQLSALPWFSKSTITKEEEAPVVLDHVLQTYIDNFKDKVVIKSMDPGSFMRRDISKSNDEFKFKTTSPKKNFKKFQKVLPKHPQTTIVQLDKTIPANSSKSI